jgi:hypothetical protein
MSKSNTFFDDEFSPDQDIFAAFGTDNDAMSITPTPTDTMQMTASSIFGSDATSLLTSSSTSISTRFKNTLNVNDEKENHTNSSIAANLNSQFQERQVNKLLNSPAKINMAATTTTTTAPNKRNALNKKKKNEKFRPTNLFLAQEEKVNNNYNHNLNMEPQEDDLHFSQVDYEITASGQFHCQGLKISDEGITALPQMTLSQLSQQSQSQTMSMNFAESPVKTFSQFPSPQKQKSFDLTFDSPPHKKKNDLKKYRHKPYQAKASEKIEDFVVVQHLGDGASSRVDLVRSTKDGTLYAKKVITNMATSQPKIILNEVQSLEKCKSCPYIIQLYQAYYKDGNIHILLEYMDGNSLQEVLRLVKRIPERIVKLIALQVLKGLHYLHNNSKIVHRDIKPANILIKKNGQVKLSDFGLTGIYSRRKHGNDQNFGNGKHYGAKNPLVFATCQGTVLYMSPERIREEKHSFNSDIWSMGITLAELLTGAFPFKSVQYFDVLDEINNMKELPIINGLCSEQCKHFLNTCVVVDPSRRPSAADLLQHPFVSALLEETEESICAEVSIWLRQSNIQ